MGFYPEPRRLSTDIDIIVEPGVDVDECISRAGYRNGNHYYRLQDKFFCADVLLIHGWKPCQGSRMVRPADRFPGSWHRQTQTRFSAFFRRTAQKYNDPEVSLFSNLLSSGLPADDTDVLCYGITQDTMSEKSAYLI